MSFGNVCYFPALGRSGHRRRNCTVYMPLRAQLDTLLLLSVLSVCLSPPSSVQVWCQARQTWCQLLTALTPVPFHPQGKGPAAVAVKDMCIKVRGSCSCAGHVRKVRGRSQEWSWWSRFDDKLATLWCNKLGCFWWYKHQTCD